MILVIPISSLIDDMGIDVFSSILSQHHNYEDEVKQKKYFSPIQLI